MIAIASRQIHVLVLIKFQIKLTISSTRELLNVLSESWKSHDITENVRKNRRDEGSCSQKQERAMKSKQACIG